MAERERPVVGFVGATGGAGTTRTVVEVAAALAADGQDVCVVDAAFATQGLADYLTGRLAPDVTALVTDDRDADLAAGLVDLDVDGAAGRLAALPANAPFERLARAKSVDAARALEARIETAAARFDHVLVDVPPIAANQAVAAVTVADSIAIVAPATERGAAATQRTHERLADVGVDAALVVSTRGAIETADVEIPTAAQADVSRPTGGEAEGAFGEAIDRVAAAVTGAELAPADDGGVLRTVGEYVGR
ncbi:AAA family ATPase [Halobellus clavatus]|jgi:cellulose biosynthesis protein BcsQ|uniref:AAA domain-containing protein n=1 Tax=Halobellus clavatus TaxID=660517 RepID=A0A1H3EMC8_9EURY|nr:AAA family ATPase [Halobellus clavatus]SDX79114.1 AAA domain-containing protein [Halobellus clavatus]